MVKAFGMAQKASDYILQYDAELKKAAWSCYSNSSGIVPEL